MRILFVSPGWPPLPGGGEQYAAMLARRLVRAGHQVTAVTSAATAEQDFWRGRSDSTQTQTDDELPVTRCPLQPFPGGRTALLAWRKAMVMLSALPGDQSAVLMRMSRRIPPLAGLEAALEPTAAGVDLIHAFNISWEYPLVGAYRLAQRLGLPLIVTPFAHFGEGRGDRVARNSTMDHQRRILREAARLMVLTHIEAEQLAVLGVSRQRLSVVGGGLADPPDGTSPEALRARYPDLPPRYALFVGRLSADKGAIHAAQAALALRRRIDDLTLLLAGQPDPAFDRFYARLDAAGRAAIRPLGIVAEADKHALLQSADMLLLPSRTDSFGIVLLEAWAYGKPVIGARAGGIPGVIDEGRNGLLVPYGDVAALSEATAALWVDAALRERLGQNGRQKVETVYTWERVAQRVIAGYEEVLAGR